MINRTNRTTRAMLSLSKVQEGLCENALTTENLKSDSAFTSVRFLAIGATQDRAKRTCNFPRRLSC